MEGGRIEARGDAEVTVIAQDQFEGSWGLDEVMINGGRQRPGTDMNGQEGRRLNSGGKVGRWVVAASRARSRGRESGSETIEPVAEGMQRNASELAELDLGQSGPTEVGEDRGPVELS
jgi:hypothetical protein